MRVKSDYVCPVCRNVDGCGTGAWGFCSRCECKTWTPGTYARDAYDQKHPENKEIDYTKATKGN